MNSKPTYEELEHKIKELEESWMKAEKRVRSLNDSNEGFLKVLDGIEAIVYVVDMETYEIIYANNYTEELIGEDLPGKICWQVLQEGQGGPCDFCTNDRLLTSEGKSAGLYRWQFRNPKTGRWYVAYDYAIKWVDGRMVRLEIAYDITDHKVDEEALRESERRLKESQRIARLGQWELDLVTNTLHWSEGIYDLFEIDPKEFGASYEAFLDAIHPDDREFVDNAYTESVKNRTPYDIVHRLLLKDGTIRYVNEICRTEYDEAGNPLRSLGTVQDITERMQAEEALRESETRLKEAQRMGKIGHWEFDLDTQETTWSDMIYEFHERDPSQGPSDFSEYLTLYAPEDSERMQKKVLRAIETGESLKIDFKANYPSGKTAYYCSTFHPIKDDTGRVIKVRGTQQDITDRKLAEEERERLIHELQSALDNIKTLKGLLPICSNCKKIRDDKGYWNQLERYIEVHSDASFSHGLCPECMDKIYGDEEWFKKRKKEKNLD